MEGKQKETERDVTRLPLLSTLSSLAGLIRQEDARSIFIAFAFDIHVKKFSTRSVKDVEIIR